MDHEISKNCSFQRHNLTLTCFNLCFSALTSSLCALRMVGRSPVVSVSRSNSISRLRSSRLRMRFSSVSSCLRNELNRRDTWRRFKTRPKAYFTFASKNSRVLFYRSFAQGYNLLDSHITLDQQITCLLSDTRNCSEKV